MSVGVVCWVAGPLGPVGGWTIVTCERRDRRIGLVSWKGLAGPGLMLARIR